MSIRILVSAFLLNFMVTATVEADSVVLNPDHPDRHVVVKGDTLWGIAERFLRDPWQWPEIWHVNPEIANPHLIYPGDTIYLTIRDGKPVLALERGLPTVKLAPSVRATKIEAAIPTVPMEAIQQFLLRAHVVTQEEIDGSGYIVAMEEGHLVAGSDNRVYARRIDGAGGANFDVFRVGKVYRNPGAKKDEVLGYEAIQVADARAEAFGDPATLVLTNSYRESLIGDRVRPTPAQGIRHNFIPRAPATPVSGQIISLFDAVARVGQFQTVVLNLGKKDGMEQGHVLAVYRAGDKVRDTVDPKAKGLVRLPDVHEGVVMVFRVFENVSYALVMEATKDIHIYDMVRNP